MIDSAPLSVSIVIPTYNRAATVRATLGSLLHAGRALPPFLREIVVADDGSTDDTRAVVESFGERVRYIRNERVGQAVGRNRGVAQTTGTHVLFLDDDLLPPPDYLERVYQTYKSVECDWIVGGIVTAPTLPDTSFMRYLRSTEAARPTQGKLVESVMEGSVTAANLFVEKKSFLELGGFPSNYTRAGCEDIDLGERALKAGIRIWYAPELSVDHYDLNILDFKRFATRQHHGCVLLAQFFDRFPHLRSESALVRKFADRIDEGRLSGEPNHPLQKLMATSPARRLLTWGASAAERAPVPDRIKWLLYRASISAQMSGGFSEGLRRRNALSDE